MNYKGVNAQISDLPSTFQRFGPIFAGLISSLSAMLARSTDSINNLSPAMTNLSTARWGWLDAIGKLYGIPRNQYETDPQYKTRLMGTLTASHGTPQSIVNFIKLALNLNTTITEDFNLVNYQINFSNPPSQSTLQNVAVAIKWVRPAGIPFLPFYIIKGGLYLSTVNYLGNSVSMTGSYLAKPSASLDITLAPNTNNPQPLLPTVYLEDSYITGTAQVNFPI